MQRSWYEIRAQNDDEAEVLIYDEIGFWGVTAQQFINDFKRISPKAKVTLRINSPGGDILDGIAIFNVIQRHEGEVIATIDGLAASMASVIALAGNKLIMPENAFMMIHNPWGLTYGEADELRDFADLLDKMKSTIVNVYVKKSGQSEKKVSELMDETTWMTGQEAKDLGFADEVTAALKAAASVNLSRFKNLPAGLRDKEPTDKETGGRGDGETGRQGDKEIAAQEIRAAVVEEERKRAADILDICSKVGISDVAMEYHSLGFTADQVRDRLADAQPIRDACTAARLPDRANGYIKAGMKIEEVRKELLLVKHRADPGEINNKFGPDGGTKTDTKAKINPLDIYAARRKAVGR